MNSAKSGTHATRPRPLVARPRPLWCRTARAHRKGDLQRDLQKRLQLMEKLIHKFIFRGVFHHIPFFIGLIVFFSFASPSPGHAKTVWCTNCSEKFTQALDRVTNVEQLRNIVADYQESVQQTIQQVRMVQQNVEQYANMVQNTIGLPAEIYGKVHGTFTRLANLTSQLLTSRGDLSAMAGIFRNIYAESDKMASLMTLPMDDLQKTNFLYHFLNINDRKELTKELTACLVPVFPDITKKEVRKAVDEAFAAYEKHMLEVRRKGEEAVAWARANGKPIMILAGRPYHIDPEIGHGIDKLAASLGFVVVSEDSVCHLADPVPVHVLNQWTYHARLYRAARYACEHADTQLVQLVSFGCGVDAITTDEVRRILEESDKLYTQIKIDEITNLGAVKIRLRSLIGALEEKGGAAV